MNDPASRPWSRLLTSVLPRWNPVGRVTPALADFASIRDEVGARRELAARAATQIRALPAEQQRAHATETHRCVGGRAVIRRYDVLAGALMVPVSAVASWDEVHEEWRPVEPWFAGDWHPSRVRCRCHDRALPSLTT